MSHVLTVLITTNVGDDDKQPALEAWWRQNREDSAPNLIRGGDAGGGKMPQQCVYFGAHNHTSIAAVLDGILSVPWETPEDVQLFVCDENDNRFTEVTIPWQWSAKAED